MNNPPEGKSVVCPTCGEDAIAIVPRGSTVVERQEAADGKVRVNCTSCGDRFVVYYRVN